MTDHSVRERHSLLMLLASFVGWFGDSPCVKYTSYPLQNGCRLGKGEFRRDPLGCLEHPGLLRPPSWLGRAEKMLFCSPAFTG